MMTRILADLAKSVFNMFAAAAIIGVLISGGLLVKILRGRPKC